jgi:hypothetical protein
MDTTLIEDIKRESTENNEGDKKKKKSSNNNMTHILRIGVTFLTAYAF